MRGGVGFLGPGVWGYVCLSFFALLFELVLPYALVLIHGFVKSAGHSYGCCCFEGLRFKLGVNVTDLAPMLCVHREADS
jgi:hypothetical protein